MFIVMMLLLSIFPEGLNYMYNGNITNCRTFIFKQFEVNTLVKHQLETIKDTCTIFLTLAAYIIIIIFTNCQKLGH